MKFVPLLGVLVLFITGSRIAAALVCLLVEADGREQVAVEVAAREVAEVEVLVGEESRLLQRRHVKREVN